MNKELEVLNQCTAMTHDMMQWVLTANHVAPLSVITAQEGIDVKRMADEYEMIGRAITILRDTKNELISIGTRPTTYEEQIAEKFPLLVDPQFARMASHALVQYSSIKQQMEINAATHLPEYRIAVNNIAWLQTMENMFQRLSTMMITYQHLTQRTSK